MIFLRLFVGHLLQVFPFAVLSFYPFLDRLRFSRRKAAAATAALLLCLAALFAGAGCFLQRRLPGDYTLFRAVNAAFMVSLVPCLLWYFFLVRAEWSKKLLSSCPAVSPLSVTARFTTP